MSKSVVDLEKFCSKVDKSKYLQLGQELISSNIGKAFSLLSFGLSLDESEKQQYYELYFNVLESWSNILLQNSRYEDALKIFEVAQDLYPESPDLKYLLAFTLYRIGKTREAWEYSLTVLKTCKKDPKVRHLVSNLTNALVDQWHFPMINDCQRNEKYREGIRNCLKGYHGNMPVLDIGAGSGLLSIYASQLGGHPVFACEVDEFMCEMAENVLNTNSITDVSLLNSHSKNIEIPSTIPARVAVVVTETFDAGLFGEGILATLRHAWSNLLLPPLGDCIESPSGQISKGKQTMVPVNEHGRVIPNNAEIWVALFECNYIAKQTKIISEGSVFKNVNVTLDLKEPYLSEKLKNLPGKYMLLTTWKKVLEINFNSPTKIERLLNGQEDQIIKFAIEREGRVDGIILSYKLYIDEENCISTFPNSETCWENAIYPITYLEIMKSGTQIEIEMKYDKVLHFYPIKITTAVNQNYPSISLNDPLFFKCINSISFRTFYNTIGKTINTKCGQHSTTSSILDICPYPEGGLTLLDLNPNNRLYISNENTVQVLKKCHVATELDFGVKEFDIIFYWPFSPEGTLKENLFEEIKMYRKRLTKKGKMYPKSIYLHTLGINSPHIEKMTRIDNANTCGINISDVFDLINSENIRLYRSAVCQLGLKTKLFSICEKWIKNLFT